MPTVLCAQVSKLRRVDVKLVRVAVGSTRELNGISQMLEVKARKYSRHMIRNNVHGCHFVLLFPLHPSVLEPDLDLSLGETQGVRDFDSSSASQVAVEVELFLQLQRLVASV